MTKSNEPTRLIKADERRSETMQTAGMRREEAVRTPSMWAGLAITAPRMFSGWHHHGRYESVIQVLSGRVRLEFGRGGTTVLEAGPGETLYVAPGEIHREGNPGDVESESWVVRGGEGEIVVNVPGPASD
jgi:uncharacterized RmlC-like cupin family protein